MILVTAIARPARTARAVPPALCRRGAALPFLHPQPGRAELRDLPPARDAAEAGGTGASGMIPSDARQRLLAEAAKRILITDGGNGDAARYLATKRVAKDLGSSSGMSIT